MADRRGSERLSLSGSGGHPGTAMAPAYKQPKNAADVIQARWVEQQYGLALYPKVSQHARDGPGLLIKFGVGNFLRTAGLGSPTYTRHGTTAAPRAS